MTHRNDTAIPAYSDDGIVTLRPPPCGVDDHPYRRVHLESRGLGLKHCCDVRLPEDLLKRVEGQAGELGLNQVWSVLHHDFELPMPLLTLPARHEMQEMVAFVRAAVFLTGLARELDGATHEEGSAGGGVEHLDETRVEVNLRGESADGDETCVSN